jgi:LPXTG-motif cell wall-anchored protein
MDIFDGRPAIARASRLLAVLATVSLVISGLLVAPARAQVVDPPDLTDIVFDVVVDIEEGECSAAGCRNVTFDARLVEDETSTLNLTEEQLADLNAALEAGDFEITVTDSEGREHTVEDGGTLCLPPGEITVTATVVDPEGSAAVVTALATVLEIEEDLITAEGITINDLTEEPFTVEDCPDDGDGDAACENPQEVASIDETDADGLVEFTTTGDRFRVSYAVNFEDDAASNEFTLTIRDSSGTVVEEISVTEDADAEIIISEGPGTFELEAEVVEGEATFDVIVEDCVGDDDNGNGDDDGRDDDDGRNDRDDDGRIDDDDDGSIVIVDEDDGRIDDGKKFDDGVIIASIPNKKLPNTGGPAILAPAVAMLISGAALGLFLVRRR